MTISPRGAGFIPVPLSTTICVGKIAAFTGCSRGEGDRMFRKARRLLLLICIATALAETSRGGNSADQKDQPQVPPRKTARASTRPEPEITLRVGDRAPALKATEWLQGD